MSAVGLDLRAPPRQLLCGCGPVQPMNSQPHVLHVQVNRRVCAVGVMLYAY